MISDTIQSLAEAGHLGIVLLLLLMLILGAGAVVKIARMAGPPLTRVVHAIDDWAGEPARPGVEARPGAMERIAAVEGLVRDLVEQGRRAAEAAEAAARAAEGSAKVAAQAARSVEIIKHQVLSDGGDSLRDQIDKLRAELGQHMSEARAWNTGGDGSARADQA